MKFSDAFTAILKSRRVSYRTLAERAGEIAGKSISPQAVSSMVRKGNPTFGAAEPYLEALGYRAVLVPVGCVGLLPEGCHVIGGGDES